MTSHDRIIDELVGQLTPVKPATSPWRPAAAWWLAALIATALAFAAALGLRADLSERLAHLGFVLQSAGLIAASFLAAWAILTLGIPGRSTLRRQRLFALALPALVGLLWFLRSLSKAVSDPDVIHYEFSELHCTIAILGLSLIPGALLFALARRYASTTPGWSGALVGTAASLLAAGSLALHCPNDTPWHLLLWHGLLPVSIAAILGASARTPAASLVTQLQ